MRVFDRLDELYAIGGGPGANRPYGSPAEDEAHELAAGWLAAAGLDVEIDRHGNLFGRSSTRDDVWVGSHLDTVPQGGRFDGALGVVAAIEAVERVGAGTVVAFRGEEVGCIGSRALVAAGGPLPEGVSRAPCRAGPEACRRRRTARRRHVDRGLRACGALPRRIRRPRGNHTHGRPRRCARRGGRADPRDPRCGAEASRTPLRRWSSSTSNLAPGT